MQTLEEYVRAFGCEPKEKFLREVPCPLLVCRDLVPISDAGKNFRTTSMTAKELQRAAAGAATTLVLKIVKRPDGPFPNYISLGRTRTTDVTLESSQVSKFHAYFAWDEPTQAWTITDAGSTNGTAVESRPLVAKQPAPLKDGSRLNFGTLEAVFRLPGDFHDSLRALSD